MAIDPVEIVFRVGGVAEVQSAFRTVEQAMAKAERSQETSSRRAARITTESHRKAGADVAQDAERQARALQRIRERSALMTGREAAKAAAEEIRAAERAERDKTRLAEQGARARNTIMMNSARMAGRYAEQAAAAEARAAAQSQRRFASAVGRGVGVAGSAISNVAGRAIQLGAGALALGGGFALSDAVTRSMSAEKAAVAVANSAYVPGAEGAQGIRQDPKAILARAKAVQATTNIDKGELLTGLQSYVAKSADLEGGQNNLEFFAKLAKASGSNFGDVMGAAGFLKTQNRNLSDEDMRTTMLNIIGQGKLGAVELPDLAKIAGKITASSAMYSGSQTVNQRELLGLAQIAVKTSGSAEEAGTTVARLGSDTLANQKALKAAGVTAAGDANGMLGNKGDLIAQVFKAAKGNLGTIQGMGYGERSIRLFEALAPTYQDAEAKQKGSGYAAVKAEAEAQMNQGYAQKDVDEDLRRVLETNSEKIDQAMTKLREVIADKATPYISRFADQLPALIPKVESFINSMGHAAEWASGNPMQAIFAAISASVAKDAAAMGLGKVISDALSKSPSISIPIAAAAITIAAVEAWGAADVKTQKTDSTDALSGVNAAVDLTGKPMTEERRKELNAKRLELTGKLNDAKQRREDMSTYGGGDVGEAIGYNFARAGEQLGMDTGATDAFNTRAKALDTTIATLEESIKRLTGAMNTATGAVPGKGAVDPKRVVSQGAPERGGAGK